MKTKATAADLLAHIESRQILLFAEGDRIMVRGTLNAELRQQLIDLKPELLRLAPRRRWRVALPGREVFNVDCAGHPMTADEIRNIWVGAKVEPAS